MRLQKLIVENYRSLRRVEIELSRLSVFVGQNNHGKTNLFEAINWFYNAKATDAEEHFEQDDANVISVELHFGDVLPSDIDKLIPANQTKIKALLDGASAFAIYKRSGDHKRRYVVNGEDKGNPQGLDSAINEFLPKLEYVNTRTHLNDVAKYKDKNPIGLMLSGVLTTIIEGSPEYQEFRKNFSQIFESDKSVVRQELDKLGGQVQVYLQKQFPNDTTVKFTVNPPQLGELLKSFDISVDDGIATAAQAKGDGMQRALMLSIIQAFADYRRKQQGGGSFLFLIDEAELHLHPSAQRALKRALIDICVVDQVMVNTHSSVLVVDDHEIQTIIRAQKDNHETTLTEIDDLGKVDVIFELLGGSPSDLLLPRNFLIVEGRSEYEFLRVIIRRFYPSDTRGLKILFAGGDIVEQEGSLHGVHKLFAPLAGSENPIYKCRAIVLLDKPNPQQLKKYEQFKDGYPYLFDNGQVFKLPHSCLEECYPAPHTKTAAEAQALQGAKGKVEYAKQVAEAITKDQFEQQMPVVFGALMKCIEKGFAIS